MITVRRPNYDPLRGPLLVVRNSQGPFWSNYAQRAVSRLRTQRRACIVQVFCGQLPGPLQSHSLRPSWLRAYLHNPECASSLTFIATRGQSWAIPMATPTRMDTGRTQASQHGHQDTGMGKHEPGNTNQPSPISHPPPPTGYQAPSPPSLDMVV